MASNVQAAIQAAALADNYALGAEIAAREGLTGICLHCALTTATTKFYVRPWPLCDTCRELLEPEMVTYRPGAQRDGGGVFNDWAKLVDAIQHPGPKTIAFDAQHAPIRIPPGTWNMADAMLTGDGKTPVTLDNAQLQNPSAVHDLKLSGTGHQRSLIYMTTPNRSLLVSNCEFDCDGTVQGVRQS
jgi:hypothetical protein